MSKEMLQAKTCKELREVAGQMNIVGRHKMPKEKLIEAILGAEVAVSGEAKNKSAKDECKIDNRKDNDVEVDNKDEKKSTNVSEADMHINDVDIERKLKYVENAEIGALVAFKLSNGKVKSAKVTKKSTKNRKLKLETEYGAVYIVPYEDIIWVRTGLRWPRGVYKLLKGLGEESGGEKA